MSAETASSARNIRPVLDETHLAYDAIGELCDTWVGNGSKFVMNADGTYEKVENEQPQLHDEFIIEHNPEFISEVYDNRGNPIKCVTTAGFDAFLGSVNQTDTPFNRVMAELPLDYLVYTTHSVHDSKYHHPSGVSPFGIKLNDLPKVKEIVEAAYTKLPRGSTVYPEGALALWRSDKWILLDFLTAALTPPKPLVQVAPQEPSKKAALQMWSPAPVALQPESNTPQAATENNRYELGLIATSYAFTLGAGWTGSVAISNLREASYDQHGMAWGVIAVGCAIEAVLAYFASKAED